MVATRVLWSHGEVYDWAAYDESTAELLERCRSGGFGNLEIHEILDVATGATVSGNQIPHPPGPARTPTPSKPPRLPPRVTLSRALRFRPRFRLPRIMTWLRIMIALIWLTGLVTHLLGGGTDPCTCTHP